MGVAIRGREGQHCLSIADRNCTNSRAVLVSSGGGRLDYTALAWYVLVEAFSLPSLLVMAFGLIISSRSFEHSDGNRQQSRPGLILGSYKPRQQKSLISRCSCCASGMVVGHCVLAGAGSIYSPPAGSGGELTDAHNQHRDGRVHYITGASTNRIEPPIVHANAPTSHADSQPWQVATGYCRRA